MRLISYRFIASVLFVLLLPFLGVLYFIVKLSSKGPFIFKQKRIGKNKKPFVIYKIRTMVEDADVLKRKYLHLNEADGPVFKIKDDPRYTKIGKVLAHTGLDEIPQLINIIKGEMSFVGPRPFPRNEANRISKKYDERFTVLPGITSLWFIKGAHKLSFDDWMKLDLEYVERRSFWFDIKVLVLTLPLIFRMILKSSYEALQRTDLYGGCKKYCRTISFYLFLIAILLFEGLGMNHGRETAYYLILVMPFSLENLFLKKILIPKKITFLFIFFFFFSLISTIFSVNIQNSFELLVYYLSCFLIFIYVFNHKKELVKSLIFLIYGLSAVFYGYSLILKGELFSFLIPASGYQFVFSSFQSHNHLGDFVMLSLVVSLYLYIKTKVKLYLLLYFFLIPPFLLAYSRSAILSLLLVNLWMLALFLKKGKVKFFSPIFLLIVFSSFIFLFFFFIVVKESKRIPVLKSTYGILTEKLALKEKDLLANRTDYLSQALFSFWERPIWGTGANNFVYASKKYTNIPFHWSYSSHNLFIDILTTHGLFAFAPFFLIIFLIVLSSLDNPNSLFFVFLAMLFNFQTDYTHTIYSFFLLFSIVAGLIYKCGKESLAISVKSLALLSFAIFLIFNLMILSKISLQQQRYDLAFYLYPFNKSVYLPLIEIEEKKGNSKNVSRLLTLFEKFFSDDQAVFEYIANLHESSGNEGKALRYYEKAYHLDKFYSFTLIEKVYTLKYELEGRKTAEEFMNGFFSKYQNSEHTYFVPGDFKTQMINFCKINSDFTCPENLFL